MPSVPDPRALRSVHAALRGVRARSGAVEDDLLAVAPSLGEPHSQRALDDWLDQVVDTLRAVGEAAAEAAGRLPAEPMPAQPMPAEPIPAGTQATGEGRPTRASGPSAVEGWSR